MGSPVPVRVVALIAAFVVAILVTWHLSLTPDPASRPTVILVDHRD